MNNLLKIKTRVANKKMLKLSVITSHVQLLLEEDEHFLKEFIKDPIETFKVFGLTNGESLRVMQVYLKSLGNNKTKCKGKTVVTKIVCSGTSVTNVNSSVQAAFNEGFPDINDESGWAKLLGVESKWKTHAQKMRR